MVLLKTFECAQWRQWACFCDRIPSQRYNIEWKVSKFNVFSGPHVLVFRIMILPRDYNVYQKKVKKFFWSRVYQGTEINLETLNQLKPEQQNKISIAKENKSIIYAMGFPIQKLRIILNILKLISFEENFVNLKKSGLTQSCVKIYP